MTTVHFGLRDPLVIESTAMGSVARASGEQRAQDSAAAGAVADEHGL